MSDCKRSHEGLPYSFKFCPYCGKKLSQRNRKPASDKLINEKLLSVARQWPSAQRKDKFFLEVMNLPPKAAYPLVRAGVTPEQVVTMSREDLFEIRCIGILLAEMIIRSRLAYTG